MHSSFDFLRRCAEAFESRARANSCSHPVLWMIFILTAAVVISVFSHYPPYTDSATGDAGTFSGFARTPYGQAITWWLDHPLQAVPAETFFHPSAIADKTAAGPISHCDKLTFRPFLPYLSRLTGGGYWTLIVANHFAAVLGFALVYLFCLRTTTSLALSAATTWAFAASWAGGWGFRDMIYGDAVAMALILGAMVASRSLWVVLLCVLAAGFTDERALCSAPLLILFRYWEACPPFDDQPRKLTLNEWRMICLPVLLGVLAYVMCRFFATHLLTLSTGTSMLASRQMPVYHFYINYPGTLFKVFEFLWVWPAIFVLNLASSGLRFRNHLIAYFAVILPVAAIVLVVWDFDRSVFYLLPAVLGAVCFGAGSAAIRAQLAIAILIASLAWMSPLESWLGRFLG